MLAGSSSADKSSSADRVPTIRSAAQLGAKWGVVTSVRRTAEHNRLVGGVPNSFHLSGRAVDIARRAGVRHADVDAAFRKAGFVLLESLDEGDHSHFAFGTAGTVTPPPRPVQSPSADVAAALRWASGTPQAFGGRASAGK
jgi:hypothetical protein